MTSNKWMHVHLALLTLEFTAGWCCLFIAVELRSVLLAVLAFVLFRLAAFDYFVSWQYGKEEQ